LIVIESFATLAPNVGGMASKGLRA
jgi:hypothetical protein